MLKSPQAQYHKQCCTEIEYRNVTFAYDKKDMMKNVSFTANKNEMTALVGESGSGKSTIASLLARFWDIQSVNSKSNTIRSYSQFSLDITEYS